MHNDLGHPGLDEQEPNAVANLLLQLAFSQFSFQRDVGPLTGRSIALFDQTQPADPTQMEMLHGDWQTELLGCSLTEYIGQLCRRSRSWHPRPRRSRRGSAIRLRRCHQRRPAARYDLVDTRRRRPVG